MYYIKKFKKKVIDYLFDHPFQRDALESTRNFLITLLSGFVFAFGFKCFIQPNYNAIALLNTQAEKAGISLNSDNQKSFDDLSVNASTLDDIKQLESYLRLARTEYQTFNAEISKGTHASSLEAMKNTLATMPNDIALIEAKFNSNSSGKLKRFLASQHGL